MEAMCKQKHCYLTLFCDFTPEQWQNIGYEYDQARYCMLGRAVRRAETLLLM